MTMPDDGVESLPSEVTARIRDHVASRMQPARGLSAGRRFALGALAAALAVDTGALMSPDARGARAGAISVVLASVALIALATGLGMARATVGRRVVLALVPALAFYGIVVASQALHIHDAGSAAGPVSVCLMRGAMLAAVPLGVLVFLWRRTDPFTPRLSGAVLGGWAGLAGAAGLTLACPSFDFWHIALGHGGAVLGGAILGAVLARRWLEP